MSADYSDQGIRGAGRTQSLCSMKDCGDIRYTEIRDTDDLEWDCSADGGYDHFCHKDIIDEFNWLNINKLEPAAQPYEGIAITRVVVDQRVNRLKGIEPDTYKISVNNANIEVKSSPSTEYFSCTSSDDRNSKFTKNKMKRKSNREKVLRVCVPFEEIDVYIDLNIPEYRKTLPYEVKSFEEERAEYLIEMNQKRLECAKWVEQHSSVFNDFAQTDDSYLLPELAQQITDKRFSCQSCRTAENVRNQRRVKERGSKTRANDSAKTSLKELRRDTDRYDIDCKCTCNEFYALGMDKNASKIEEKSTKEGYHSWLKIYEPSLSSECTAEGVPVVSESSGTYRMEQTTEKFPHDCADQTSAVAETLVQDVIDRSQKELLDYFEVHDKICKRYKLPVESGMNSVFSSENDLSSDGMGNHSANSVHSLVKLFESVSISEIPRKAEKPENCLRVDQTVKENQSDVEKYVPINNDVLSREGNQIVNIFRDPMKTKIGSDNFKDISLDVSEPSLVKGVLPHSGSETS